MKKLLAWTLALALACSLCVPALAAEEKGAVELMEELGLLDAAGDYGFIVDGEPVPTDVPFVPGASWADDDNSDAVLEYMNTHPEELAALDADALIAGWGYKDTTAREAFEDDWGAMADSLETAVAMHYADNRVKALEAVAEAEELKAEHPDAWAAFDPEAHFASFWTTFYGSKEAFMAHENLLTQEEFTARMFTSYMVLDWEDVDHADPDAQPTLTLVVNGVASDVAISANDWTTYADAAALRGILGVKAVAPTYEGPVPVREAAQNAGWEVQWYDGGWEGLDQQVCLWNKEAFLAEIAPRVEPFQKFYDTAMERARGVVFTETPRRTVDNATITVKRFDSLDGDETYDLKLRVETVCQKGVADCTVTFDVSQLLKMFADSKLEAAAREWDFSLADLRTLLSAGKAEFIIDYNAGGGAYNIPLLGFIDEDLAGWQTSYNGMLDYSRENTNYAETLYEDMLDAASWQGGVEARADMEESLEAIAVFFGPDNVKTAGSSVTWTLETDKVNAALSKLIGDGAETFSLFKKCDLNVTFNAEGKLDLTLAYRMDADGYAETLMANGASYWELSVSEGASDVEITAAAHGDRDEATQTMKLHIKNFGVIDVNIKSTGFAAAKGPRQLAEVERTWVDQSADGATVTVAR